MKQIARRYVWFPKMDEAIEHISNSSTWKGFISILLVIFFTKMWLIVVDSFSRFPYVTSNTTIHALQEIFSVERLPNTIVSDNGSQFTSKEFDEFCRRNSIKHITSFRSYI